MNRNRSIWFPLIIIPIGSLIAMALTWLFYGLIYNLLESWFYPGNPLAFPAGFVRQTYAVALVLLFLILLHTRLSDLFKAMLMTGPLSALIITVGFLFYEKSTVSIAAMFVVTIAWEILLYFFKKPWFYVYAGGIAALVAMAYAWPAS